MAAPFAPAAYLPQKPGQGNSTANTSAHKAHTIAAFTSPPPLFAVFGDIIDKFYLSYAVSKERIP